MRVRGMAVFVSVVVAFVFVVMMVVGATVTDVVVILAASPGSF